VPASRKRTLNAYERSVLPHDPKSSIYFVFNQSVWGRPTDPPRCHTRISQQGGVQRSSRTPRRFSEHVAVSPVNTRHQSTFAQPVLDSAFLVPHFAHVPSQPRIRPCTMSAFDEARSGAAPTGRRGVRAPGAAVRAGGPGGAAAASAIEVVSGGDGYQSSDAAYATMCSAVEADLNSASQSAAQLRKQRDQVGSRQDSEDLRHRMCVAARHARRCSMHQHTV
jgi:hypothetical protein